jgi:hypothetical protein
MNPELIDLVRQKSILSKDVTDITFETFSLLKKTLLQVEKTLKQHIKDDRVKFQFRDNGTFEAELKVGDDVLIFMMYTNALVFDSTHGIYKTGYVAKDPARATCGMISIYNFLSDSFKYERRNDIGYLVARMFINKERHFFLDGKKQLGILFNSFADNVVSEEAMLAVVEKSIQYSIDLDVSVPSFDLMKEISVNEVMDYSLQASISNGKRLGFQFENFKHPPEA